jgi:hypothetical protein
MSDFDTAQFQQKVSRLSDDELIALITINAKSHVPEAMEIAKTAASERKLLDDIQEVIFDVFLNTSGFAGRLILLDEQLLFLSTGLPAAPGGSGLVGAMAGEARASARRIAADKLDFSALENEGSWIYYLDQIKDCQAKVSLLSKSLIFDVEEEDGTRINGIVRCDDLGKDQFLRLGTLIHEARTSF